MASVAKKELMKEMEVDLTPMIDIVFQLIIFFMVVTEMASKDLEDVTLPRAQHAIPDDDPPSDRMVINVTKEGDLRFKGEKFTLKELQDKISREVEMHDVGKSETDLMVAGSDLEILIRADVETQYYHVQEVIRVCTQEWVFKLNIATAKKH